MTVIRLLKSWATPPVSSPSACSFCDWNRAARASSSSSLALRRSVMSRVILAKPSSGPSSSWIGSMTTLAQKWVPSLRQRHASFSYLPSASAVASARCGSPRRPVLLGVEAREMLADDLVGLIALDRFRAGVPVGHPAVRVEHVQGIILDALDERPEAALAFHAGRARPARFSVSSRVILAKPISLPLSSRIGSSTALTQKRVPSFLHPPAFRLEPPLLRRGLQGVRPERRRRDPRR